MTRKRLGMATVLSSVFFLTCVYAGPGRGIAAGAEAGDAASRMEVPVLWEAFRADLRRGDYVSAHGRFSPASRAVFSREDFQREYHPVGVACGLVLAEPLETRLRTDGDWAEWRATVRRSDGRPALLRVAFVREDDGVWRLVAGRREREERWETEVRAWLLTAGASEATAGERLRWLERNRDQAPSSVSFYRFERRHDGIRAVARREGLRHFLLEAGGRVWAEDAGGSGRPEPTPSGVPSATMPATPAKPAVTGSAAAPRLMLALDPSDDLFSTPSDVGIRWGGEVGSAPGATASVDRSDETRAGVFPAAMRGE